MLNLQDLQVYISIATLLGIAFAIYKTFTNPDIKANDRLNLIEQNCRLKHQNLDENILAIKENHLRHLETDVSQLKIDVAKILTILEERNKKIL